MGSEVSCDPVVWSSLPTELQKFKEESWTFAEVVSGFGMMIWGSQDPCLGG